MTKPNLPYLLILLPLLLTITACNSLLNNTKPLTQPSVTEQAQPEPVIEQASTWQQAYGEQQQTGQNELTPLVATKAKPIKVTDIWQRIRQGYAIPHPVMHPDTEQQLAWFVRHPQYIDRIVNRAEPYLYYIVEQIEQRNMPLEIALLPAVESAFRPFAYSPRHAAGLWQFIPSTGRLYGLKQNWWYDGRRDVVASTDAALDYLEKLYNDFGDWQLALAAYNCGEGAVAKAIRRNSKAGKNTDFWSLNLPRETSAYVPKLMAMSVLIAQPEHYQIKLKPIKNEPYFAIVPLDKQIELAVAAQLAQLTTAELKQLNPGFKQWATDPDGPHQLVLPLAKQTLFVQGLTTLAQDQYVKWVRHKISEGESLGIIAQRYNTAVSVIKKANGINGTLIRAGADLVIPVATTAVTSSELTTNIASTSQHSGQKGDNKKIYTVKKGDTWWDIARSYKVNVQSLAAWNNKTPDQYLQPDQQLVVWVADLSNAQPRHAGLKSVNYKIQTGDSLWAIAQKFKVSIAQLVQWNRLNQHTFLQPGQILTLYSM